MPNFDNLFSIPAVKLAAIVAGGLIVAALIFDAGVDVGARRGGPPESGHGFFRAFGVALPHGYITNGHGAVGVINTIGTSSLSVSEPDGDTEIVYLQDDTFIEAPDGPTTTSAFMPGTHVVIIGSPDETHEHMYAKLIRILPPPPQQ